MTSEVVSPKPSIPTDQLSRIFADVFEIPLEQVQMNSSPENIETWDSSRHLSLVVALEQEFVVQFEPEEIEQLLSFDSIRSILMTKVAQNGAGS